MIFFLPPSYGALLIIQHCFLEVFHLIKKNSKVLFQPPSSVISHSAGISSDGNFALLISYSEIQRKISCNLQINSFKEILILRNLLNNCQESNTLTFANLGFYEKM